MPTPRKLSREEAERNKKKQQILRQAGYNVKVDGNWGEWQDRKYKEVMANNGRQYIYKVAEAYRRAKQQKVRDSNQEHLRQSKYYFAQAPTVQNLARGVYHWFAGSKWSPFSPNPNNVDLNTGIAPDITRTGIVRIGKGVRTLAEGIERRAAKQATRGAANNTSKTFEEGVQLGYARGTQSVERKAAAAAEDLAKNTVSREAAKRYGQIQASRAATEAKAAAADATQTAIKDARTAAYWEGRQAAEKQASVRLKNRFSRMFGKKSKKGSTEKPQNTTETSTTDSQTKIPDNMRPGRILKRVLWESEKNNFGPNYPYRNFSKVAFPFVAIPLGLTSLGEGNPARGLGKLARFIHDTPENVETGIKEGYHSIDSTQVNNKSVTTQQNKEVQDTSVVESNQKPKQGPIADYVEILYK